MNIGVMAFLFRNGSYLVGKIQRRLEIREGESLLHMMFFHNLPTVTQLLD